MKVLVTGSAGFIGTHLFRELRAAGHDVHGADRNARIAVDLVMPGNPGWLLHYFKPDVVIHLAAVVGRLNGERDIGETITQNAAVTTRMAHACGEKGIRLMYASTSEVYGDTGEDVAHEDIGAIWAPVEMGLRASEGAVGVGWSDPHNLYGMTKLWGEQACRLYAPEGLTTMRLSMPYGPGHPPGFGRAALTNFLDQALNRQPIPVHRGSERSWCWIGDTARAIRMLMERTEGGTFNVGRDDNAVSMKTVAEMACDLVDAPPSLIEEVDPPEMQTVVKRLSTEKLRALGWEPHVELREGMIRTLHWLRSQTEAHELAAAA